MVGRKEQIIGNLLRQGRRAQQTRALRWTIGSMATVRFGWKALVKGPKHCESCCCNLEQKLMKSSGERLMIQIRVCGT